MVPTAVSSEPIEIDVVDGHLPNLDAAGVVVQDDGERRVVSRGDDRVERFLDPALRGAPARYAPTTVRRQL